MTDYELLKKSLDALETKGEHHPRVYQAIAALRERLAQPEKKEEWVGLTEDEIVLIVGECAASHRHDDLSFAKEIEAKLREKNGG